MSDDPETARQIAELARDTRPLLVLDVDDVLLEFINPFISFLDGQDVDLRLDTFKLHENAIDRRTGTPLERERISALIDTFFQVQADWQTGANGAADALRALAPRVEIVLLTAMPHRHRATRRTHLDQLGFPYPLLTTETPKGPAIRMLRGERPRPVAFVDDIPRNLISVREATPETHLFHMMSAPSLRALLPPLPERVTIVDAWSEAGPMIADALGV